MVEIPVESINLRCKRSDSVVLPVAVEPPAPESRAGPSSEEVDAIAEDVGNSENPDPLELSLADDTDASDTGIHSLNGLNR